MMRQSGGNTMDDEANNQENQQLGAVSFTQQFSWTGLSSSSALAATVDPSNANFALEGLLLWNVLGYALDEGDYDSLSLVCKEWRRVVRILEPPAMWKIARLLNHQPVCSQTKKKVLIQESQIDLLKNAFCSLKSRESPLYRKIPIEEQQPSSNGRKKWPCLQPQFNVLLMRFVYALSTQSLAIPLYDMIATFFESFAREVVQNMTTILLNHNIDNSLLETMDSRALFQLVQLLLDQWYVWEGVLSTVGGIAYNFNRLNVPHLVYAERTSMARCLIQAVTTTVTTMDSSAAPASDNGTRLLLVRTSIKQLAQRVGRVRSTEQPATTAHQRRLLLDASRVCELMSTLINSYMTDPLNNRSTELEPRIVGLVDEFQQLSQLLKPTLEQARQEEEDSLAPLEQFPDSHEATVTITTTDKRTFSFPCSCAFLKASDFLQRLNLQAGDQIRLAVNSLDLQRAAEFYAIPEPYPILPSPLLGGHSVRTIVGDTYADFVESMENDGMFRLVSFGHLLGLREIVELCCLRIALNTMGRSREEIRAMLNL